MNHANPGGELSRRSFLKASPAVLAVPILASQVLAQDKAQGGQAAQDKAQAAPPAKGQGPEPYAAMKFEMGKLEGFSDEQVSVHLDLYNGYVKQVNALNKELADMSAAGKAGTPGWNEIKRRLGFEYDGMRLHEYYFGHLKAGGSKLEADSPLAKALAASYGSVDAWKEDFLKMSTMRGIGWVIAYRDPWTSRISNHWITLHEEGHPAGFSPIVVMDLWEHAFLIDWRPATKAKYVETFFKNLDYAACAKRMGG